MQVSWGNIAHFQESVCFYQVKLLFHFTFTPPPDDDDGLFVGSRLMSFGWFVLICLTHTTMWRRRWPMRRFTSIAHTSSLPVSFCCSPTVRAAIWPFSRCALCRAQGPLAVYTLDKWRNWYARSFKSYCLSLIAFLIPSHSLPLRCFDIVGACVFVCLSQ